MGAKRVPSLCRNNVSNAFDEMATNRIPSLTMLSGIEKVKHLLGLELASFHSKTFQLGAVHKLCRLKGGGGSKIANFT